MFGTTPVKVVEVGTVMEWGDEKLTVTDEQAVLKDGTIYATQAVYDALKAQTKEA